MPLVAIDYRFSQRFAVPAAEAYAWATDYTSGDIEILGFRGRRKVEELCRGAFLLTDTIVRDDGTRVVKRKLVRLYPERLSYVNTHIAGPNKYSQFFYEMVPEGKNASRLDFTGREVLPLERQPGARERAAMARRIRGEDAAMWKRIARAMARDLGRA